MVKNKKINFSKFKTLDEGLTDKSSEMNIGDEYTLYNKIKVNVIGAKDFVMDVLKYTKTEIVVGALAGAIMLGSWSYRNEAIKNHTLRLSFSETEQIERQAERLGMDVPNVTDFLSKTNDFYMKIFEAHNNSWENTIIGDNTHRFSMELEYHMDPAFKIHKYEFPQLNKLVPELADSVLKEFSYIKSLQGRVNSTVKVLENTWDDYHHDSYHTEVYYETETYTDSDGESHTRPVMHTKQVYDHTDNTYTYYKANGEQAAIMLRNITTDFPKIKTEGLFMPAVRTNADNEYVMYKSRKPDLDGKSPTEEEYLLYANNWLFNSRLFTDLKNLEELRSKLGIEGNTWQRHKNTAKSYTQRTYNHSHAESDEFLTCENAMSIGNSISNLTDRMFHAIESSKKRIPGLNYMIKDYIEKSFLHEEDRDVKKLKKQIMREAIAGYEEMFPNGMPISRARWGHVPLFVLLGLVIGGAAGYSVDVLGERTNIYGEMDRDYRNPFTRRYDY
ncbi:MAG: hypothetical protein ACP5NW_01905 [Candidatus Woesearchaeota archaeon]